MGISGRIRPNPSRSIKTVKNIIEIDAFFMGMPAWRNHRPNYATPGVERPSLLLNYLHVLPQRALQTSPRERVIVQSLHLRGAGLRERRLRAEHVQLRSGPS